MIYGYFSNLRFNFKSVSLLPESFKFNVEYRVNYLFYRQPKYKKGDCVSTACELCEHMLLKTLHGLMLTLRVLAFLLHFGGLFLFEWIKHSHFFFCEFQAHILNVEACTSQHHQNTLQIYDLNIPAGSSNLSNPAHSGFNYTVDCGEQLF